MALRSICYWGEFSATKKEYVAVGGLLRILKRVVGDGWLGHFETDVLQILGDQARVQNDVPR
jgi:hypothetical protein